MHVIAYCELSVQAIALAILSSDWEFYKMRKSSLALAVAGLLSGSAYAQSNVTMYGVLDVDTTWSDSGYGRKMAVGTGGLSSSRFGFRGSEDLGGGTTAVFQLEAGFNMDTQSMGASAPALGINNNTAFSTAAANGTGPQIFSRQGLVGLQGNWGTLHLGRLYTGTYTATTSVGDPVGAGLYAGVTATSSHGMTSRVNNGVTYKTPNMNGFYGWFTYSPGSENNVSGNVPTAAGAATSTNDKAGRGYDLAFFYSNGPFNAAASYWNFNKTSWVTLGETDLAKGRGTVLTANYDFKVVKLLGTYLAGKIDGGNYENVTKSFSKTTTIFVSALIPVGAAGSIVLNCFGFDDKSLLNKDFTAWSIGYLYDMSKRTTLYADYGKLTNNANSTQALTDGGDMVGTIRSAGDDPSGFMLGMRHKF